MKLCGVIIYFLISITNAVPLTDASEPTSMVKDEGCGHHNTLFKVFTTASQPEIQGNNVTLSGIERLDISTTTASYIVSAEAKIEQWYHCLEGMMNIIISSHATYFCLIALVCVLMGFIVSKEMLLRRRRRKIVAVLLEKATRKEESHKKSMYLKERSIV